MVNVNTKNYDSNACVISEAKLQILIFFKKTSKTLQCMISS